MLAVASADVYGIVTEADLPLTEDSPVRPDQPVRRVARSPPTRWRSRRSSGTASAWCGSGPSTTSDPVSPSTSSPPPSPPASPGPSGTAPTAIPVGNLSARRDLTDVRDVVRAYRLLIERGHGRRRVQRLHRASTSPSRRSPTGSWGWPRRPVELVADPALFRPVDLPVLRGDAVEAPGRHRVGARHPDRADARRPPRRHAPARVAAAS